VELSAQSDEVEGGVDRIGRERPAADLVSLALGGRPLLRNPAAEVFGVHRGHLESDDTTGLQELG
jgi:hypothetical protein